MPTPARCRPIRRRSLGKTFQGYRRADGRVGTRNYLAIISTVNCSASVSKYVAQRFDRKLLDKYPNVDGILPLTHKGGCGLQYGGEDHHQLNRMLAGFAKHPNVGAYLLIGLGCETGTAVSLIEQGGLVQLNGQQQQKPPILSIQDCGGTNKTVEAGLAALAEMLPEVNDVRRESIPASELMLGTECGGSDGNSGVTANPALGVASDMLVAAGGTSILAETPEIYGAEHLLTRRAKSREIGEKLIERIHWWEEYTGKFGVKIDNNPSPGNKDGGLTTIYEKSLGAVAKGGHAALSGVYRYAEPVTTPRLRLHGLARLRSGQRHGPGGQRRECGRLHHGPRQLLRLQAGPVDQDRHQHADVRADDRRHGHQRRAYPVGHAGRSSRPQIFELMLEVASGRKTKSEQHGIGEEEFVPWSIGPTL